MPPLFLTACSLARSLALFLSLSLARALSLSRSLARCLPLSLSLSRSFSLSLSTTTLTHTLAVGRECRDIATTHPPPTHPTPTYTPTTHTHTHTRAHTHTTPTHRQTLAVGHEHHGTAKKKNQKSVPQPMDVTPLPRLLHHYRENLYRICAKSSGT